MAHVPARKATMSWSVKNNWEGVMGDRQEELQASVELIWEYADEACKPGSDLRPDIEYGKELLLAAPDLLKLVEDWVAEVDDTMDYDEMTPEYQQLYDRATELIGRVGS